MRRGHRTAHARMWLVIVFALPVMVALAIIFSDSPPRDTTIEAARAAASGT